MIDLIIDRWNDLLTVGALLLGAYSTRYQIKHYKAQSPDLNILEIKEARYAQDPAREINATRYDLTIVVENAGREPTTIVEESLTIQDTREEIDLQRIDGPTKMPITGDAPPDLPRRVDSKVTIPGNDATELKYRGRGDLRKDHSDLLKGTVKIGAVGGHKCDYSDEFKPRKCH